MLNRLLPTGIDETKYKRLTSIRQLARAFRNYQLTYHEAVLTADELMNMSRPEMPKLRRWSRKSSG